MEEKKMVKKNEEPASVNSFISQAISQGLPVETMERLFSLREKVKAEQAKEGYIIALSKFQGECPIIEKTKKVLNKDGRTIRYQYAPIDAIAEQIKKILVENGLSYKWEVENKPGFIKATAIITHEMGHTESSSFEIPIDTEGFMTAPQKYASALTFAKRYSLCNALGISTGDEDVDANDAVKDAEPTSLKARIVFLCRSLGIEPKTKNEWDQQIVSNTLLELKEENYKEIIIRLEQLVREKQQYDKTDKV
ncbi:MAG: ERF family protein [Patescibacteria group bacterium]|nr:ERF family protein [Patescibacteria group bacterium]MDE2439277.1 ERF family protein [Patescibacteria group bacterium]